MCAKRTEKNFDQVKVVLPIIFMSLGCTMVTLRSEKLLYINTSYHLECVFLVVSDFTMGNRSSLTITKFSMNHNH